MGQRLSGMPRWAEGKWADIVAIRGHALDDVALFGEVGFVMREGVTYQQGGASTPFVW